MGHVNYALFGATGAVGKALAAKLAKRGMPFSILWAFRILSLKQHPKLTRVALGAAAAAGVRHYVHLSTVYAYGVPQEEFVSESHPRNPKAFKGRMRREQEDLVLAADDPKGMRTTILRPTRNDCRTLRRQS